MADTQGAHPSKGSAMAIRRLNGLNAVLGAEFMARRRQTDWSAM
ncbi:hypothetical protein KYG_23560 [Acidovorax sp. NO-1]|nr:hypothetical protein KYG_23560 [Acidovorax sp. NO-1]